MYCKGIMKMTTYLCKLFRCAKVCGFAIHPIILQTCNLCAMAVWGMSYFFVFTPWQCFNGSLARENTSDHTSPYIGM